MNHSIHAPLHLAAVLGLLLAAPVVLADLSVRIYTAPTGYHGGYSYFISPHAVPPRHYRPPRYGHRGHHPDKAYARHPYGYRYAQPNPYLGSYGHRGHREHDRRRHHERSRHGHHEKGRVTMGLGNPHR